MLWSHHFGEQESIPGGLEAGVVLVAYRGGMTVTALLHWTCGTGDCVMRMWCQSRSSWLYREWTELLTGRRDDHQQALRANTIVPSVESQRFKYSHVCMNSTPRLTVLFV